VRGSSQLDSVPSVPFPTWTSSSSISPSATFDQVSLEGDDDSSLFRIHLHESESWRNGHVIRTILGEVEERRHCGRANFIDITEQLTLTRHLTTTR
jgi:hypothetical protein